MGARPLTITQRQVTAILKGAEKAGVHLEVRAESGVVRFVPVEKRENGEPEVDSGSGGYL